MRTETATDQAGAQAMTEATAAADYAPSIHDTHPWRWRLTGDSLDLYTEHGPVPSAADPGHRSAILSCGAALHHARIALAARGWRATVTRMPPPEDPEHVAHIHLGQRAPIDPRAVRQLRLMRQRHSDGRPASDGPAGAEALSAIDTSVEAQGAHLHILGPDQLLALTEAADPAWQAALAPDQVAVFAILHGDGDEPVDWLRAGEALSAAWLTATELGVSVLPHSTPVESVSTVPAMRALVAGVDHPYLVLRFGSVGL